MNVGWICRPSRSPTSRTVTSICFMSFSFEYGFAFFIERLDAFVTVLGFNQMVVRLDFETIGRLQLHLHAEAHGLLHLAHRQRRVSGDGARGLQHSEHQFLRFAQLIHEAPIVRLLRAERPPRHDDFLGAALAQRSRQILRAPRAGHDAERHFGQGEARAFDGIDEIAGQRGLEAALSCDFIYAVKGARFALTEVTLGIMPGAGGTQNLPRALGERRAKEIIMTGRPFSAQQAYDWGLVNELCEPQELMPRVLETARTIAGNAPLSVRQVKKSVRFGMQMELKTAYRDRKSVV